MRKTLYIVAGIEAVLIALSNKNQEQFEQLSNDLEKVVGNKRNIDELTTRELVNTIDVLKKHIMA